MKIIPRKETPTKAPPILPLELEEIDKNKRKFVSHQLRTSPAEANSPTYKLSTLVLDGSETVREIIMHTISINKVLTGLNVTTIADKITVTKTLLGGNALTQFNQAVERVVTARMQVRVMAAPDDAAAQAIHDAGWDHADNYEDAQFTRYVQGMVEKLIPSRALAKVKRHLRRNCRKPHDMPVRSYFQNLQRINDEEIPRLPPFTARNKFREDEFIDIILYGTPKSWAMEMERQGFDPMDKTAEEVVTFMEQLESAEEHDKSSKTVDKKSSSSNKKQKGSNKSDGSSTKDLKYCELHGKNTTHTTAECRTLKNKGKDDKKVRFSNKTWKKKADDGASTSKSEIAMLIKKAVRQELKSADKKRKASDDDSSDGENFNMEALSKGNLDGFNYGSLEQMSISSDSDKDSKNKEEGEVSDEVSV